MTVQQIKSIGFFLSSYESDLLHIRNFQLFREGDIPIDKYSKKGDHSFYNFLSEFRVARNLKKGYTSNVLKVALDWIKKTPQDVDGFAQKIKKAGLTHNKLMTSLASKILFLNCPQKILPLDTRVRNSVSQESNSYKDYLPLIRAFKRSYKTQIKECLDFVQPFTRQIESDFPEIRNKKSIRTNRMIDKLLWAVNGQLDPGIAIYSKVKARL